MISKPFQQRLQRSLRLSSCVAAILAAANPAAATALADAATPLDALARRMTSGRLARVPETGSTALLAGAIIPVTSCADDAGFDTLRHAALVANPGDTVDLSALACSKITLQNGAIDVAATDLTIAGPGRDKLTIDGAKAGRVFKHALESQAYCPRTPTPNPSPLFRPGRWWTGVRRHRGHFRFCRREAGCRR